MLQGVAVGVTSLESTEDLHERGAGNGLISRENEGDIGETRAFSVKRNNTSTIVSTVSKVGTNREMNSVSLSGGPTVESILGRDAIGGSSLHDVDGVVAISYIATIRSPKRVLGSGVGNNLVTTKEDSVSELAFSTKLVGEGERNVTGMGVLSLQDQIGLSRETDVGDVVGGGLVREKVGLLFFARASDVTKEKTLGSSPNDVPVHVAIVCDIRLTVGHSHRGGDIRAHGVGDIMDVVFRQYSLKEKEKKNGSKLKHEFVIIQS